jgi:hypothetical protein
MPQAPQQPQGSDTGSAMGLLAGSTGLPASAMPTAPQNPTTAAQNGSTISDIAERGVGGIAGSLLDIAAAGGRMVGANDFANQAVDARNQINEKIARDTSGSVAGKVAGAVGSAVPYVAAGGASLPTAVAGGAVAGATPAIADNKSGAEIARDAAVGAGAGAAGFGVGKALGAGSLRWLRIRPLRRASPRRKACLASLLLLRLRHQRQETPRTRMSPRISRTHLATRLTNSPRSSSRRPRLKTPGYTPTAAELANDANVTTVQKASTNANPSVFANASAENDAAIANELAQRGTPNNPGAPANPQAVDQAAEAAAQRSDALAAQGQAEVKPIAPDVAQKLQTPQFEAPVKLAQRMARDEGSTVFDDFQKARQADAGNTLKQVIGTPEQLDAMKAARSTQATDDLKQIFQNAKAGQPGSGAEHDRQHSRWPERQAAGRRPIAQQPAQHHRQRRRTDHRRTDAV